MRLRAAGGQRLMLKAADPPGAPGIPTGVRGAPPAAESGAVPRSAPRGGAGRGAGPAAAEGRGGLRGGAQRGQRGRAAQVRSEGGHRVVREVGSGGAVAVRGKGARWAAEREVGVRGAGRQRRAGSPRRAPRTRCGASAAEPGACACFSLSWERGRAG